MASRLIIYNSTDTGSQILAANIALHAYPDATVKDVAAVTTGDITTYCGTTLVDATYTDIFICTTTQLAGATGLLSYDQVALMIPKMLSTRKGTVERANTCQANVTVTDIILDASASAVNDYYNGMYIVTAGTTGIQRYIKDYTGASTTCLVNTTSTAVTTTETFIVYSTLDYIYQLGNTNGTTGKTACVQAWDLFYAGITYPKLVQALGGYLNVLCSGTATAVAAGTITLDATGATRGLGDRLSLAEMIVADSVANCYVYVYSATTGACQKRQITTSTVTAAVCTLASNWDITPTGTLVYRVVNHDDWRIYADVSFDLYVRAKWLDIEDQDTIDEVEKCIDQYLQLRNSYLTTGEAVAQDEDFIDNTIRKVGDFAFLTDALGIL